MNIQGSATAAVLGGEREVSTTPVVYDRSVRVQCARCRRWYRDAQLLDDDGWCTPCLDRWAKPDRAAVAPVAAAVRDEPKGEDYGEQKFAEPPAAIVVEPVAPRPAAKPKVQIRRDTITGRWWVNSPTGAEPYDTWAEAMTVANGGHVEAKPKPRAKRKGGRRRVDVDRIVELYRAGTRISVIASTLGHEPRTVRSALDAAGIERRDERGLARPGARVKLAIDVDTVRRLYVDERKTIAEIAELAECSGTTVIRLMERHGIPRRAHGDAQRGKPRPHAGQASSALKDRIAAAGVTSRDIRAWAHANHVEVPSRGPVPAALIDAYEAAHSKEQA